MNDTTSVAAIAAGTPPVDTTSIPAAGFRRKSSTIAPLTPELAKRFKDMGSAHTERLINQKRIKHLRHRVSTGVAVTFFWSEAYVKSLNATVRVNGMHSSNLLADWDGPWPSNLTVCHEVYECETEDDLALLHQQFDDRRSARSVGDLAAVYQGLQPALVNLERSMAKLAVDGYIWHARRIEHVTSIPSGEQAYDRFKNVDLHPYIIWLASLHTSKTREMQMIPVAAAMYGTFRVNEAVAKEFWEHVSRGGDPEQPELPATALDEWLRAAYEGTSDETITPNELYQGCVTCWNAHRDGKTISSIKYSVKKNFSVIKA